MLMRAIPVFRIFDIEKAKDFYVSWLGFKIDWEHKYEENFPLYMQVSRDDLVLHLSEHHGDCCPGGKIYVETDKVKSLHAELSAKNYKFNKPSLSENEKSFDVIDPFGNKISFNNK